MHNRVTAADLPPAWADWPHDLQLRYLALCRNEHETTSPEPSGYEVDHA